MTSFHNIFNAHSGLSKTVTFFYRYTKYVNKVIFNTIQYIDITYHEHYSKSGRNTENINDIFNLYISSASK